MRVFRTHLIVFPLLSWAASSFACETEPDRFRLPGESETAAEQRFEKTDEDLWVIRSYYRETHSFEQAKRVYLARVLTSVPMDLSGAKYVYPSSVVQPLLAIKGDLPSSSKTLAMKTPGSCDSIGYGDGVSASPGTYVFVFEGLPKTDTRPNGIDSMHANQVRTFELLEPLSRYLESQPN